MWIQTGKMDCSTGVIVASNCFLTVRQTKMPYCCFPEILITWASRENGCRVMTWIELTFPTRLVSLFSLRSRFDGTSFPYLIRICSSGSSLSKDIVTALYGFCKKASFNSTGAKFSNTSIVLSMVWPSGICASTDSPPVDRLRTHLNTCDTLTHTSCFFLRGSKSTKEISERSPYINSGTWSLISAQEPITIRARGREERNMASSTSRPGEITHTPEIVNSSSVIWFEDPVRVVRCHVRVRTSGSTMSTGSVEPATSHCGVWGTRCSQGARVWGSVRRIHRPLRCRVPRMYLIKACWSCPKTLALNARALFENTVSRKVLSNRAQSATTLSAVPSARNAATTHSHCFWRISSPSSLSCRNCDSELLAVLFARWRMAFQTSRSQHVNKNKFTVCHTDLSSLSLFLSFYSLCYVPLSVSLCLSHPLSLSVRLFSVSLSFFSSLSSLLFSSLLFSSLLFSSLLFSSLLFSSLLFSSLLFSSLLFSSLLFSSLLFSSLLFSSLLFSSLLFSSLLFSSLLFSSLLFSSLLLSSPLLSSLLFSSLLFSSLSSLFSFLSSPLFSSLSPLLSSLLFSLFSSPLLSSPLLSSPLLSSFLLSLSLSSSLSCLLPLSSLFFSSLLLFFSSLSLSLPLSSLSSLSLSLSLSLFSRSLSSLLSLLSLFSLLLSLSLPSLVFFSLFIFSLPLLSFFSLLFSLSLSLFFFFFFFFFFSLLSSLFFFLFSFFFLLFFFLSSLFSLLLSLFPLFFFFSFLSSLLPLPSSLFYFLFSFFFSFFLSSSLSLFSSSCFFFFSSLSPSFCSFLSLFFFCSLFSCFAPLYVLSLASLSTFSLFFLSLFFSSFFYGMYDTAQPDVWIHDCPTKHEHRSQNDKSCPEPLFSWRTQDTVTYLGKHYGCCRHSNHWIRNHKQVENYTYFRNTVARQTCWKLPTDSDC